MTAVPEHDDATMDAIAMVEAVREDDTGDIAVILRACNSYAVALALAKMLAGLVAANERGEGACQECFRDWCIEAARR